MEAKKKYDAAQARKHSVGAEILGRELEVTKLSNLLNSLRYSPYAKYKRWALYLALGLCIGADASLGYGGFRIVLWSPYQSALAAVVLGIVLSTLAYFGAMLFCRAEKTIIKVAWLALTASSALTILYIVAKLRAAYLTHPYDSLGNEIGGTTGQSVCWCTVLAVSCIFFLCGFLLSLRAYQSPEEKNREKKGAEAASDIERLRDEIAERNDTVAKLDSESTAEAKQAVTLYNNAVATEASLIMLAETALHTYCSENMAHRPDRRILGFHITPPKLKFKTHFENEGGKTFSTGMIQVLFLALLSLFASCSKDSQPKRMVAVSVLVDVTDTGFLISPNIAAIFPLFGLTESPSTETFFTVESLSDKVYTTKVAGHLVSGTDADRLNIHDDPYFRGRQLAAFKGELKDALWAVQNSDRALYAQPISIIYQHIAIELQRLSTTTAGAKILVLYTDLIEKSPLLDSYSPRGRNLLLTIPDSVGAMFNRLLPLPFSLAGISVIVVFKPRNADEDRLFQSLVTVYKKLLTERHAVVSIQTSDINIANLENYEHDGKEK